MRRVAVLVVFFVVVAVAAAAAGVYAQRMASNPAVAETPTPRPSTSPRLSASPSHSPSPAPRPSASPSASRTAKPSPSPSSGALVSGPRDLTMPMLMYHHIDTLPSSASAAKYYVSPAHFAEQMDWFAAKGYHAVTLQRVWDFWHGKGKLPTRPFIITFDDGYRSVYEHAAPVLKEHGWPAVLNLVGDFINTNPGLTDAMINRLIARGWEIESHTMTHPDLTKVSATRLAAELTLSRRKLQNRYHVPVNFICYPGGAYNATVIAAAKKAGYLGGISVHFGHARPSEPYSLRRLLIDNTRVGKMLISIVGASKKY